MSAGITLRLRRSAWAREDSRWLTTHMHTHACTIPPEINFRPDARGFLPLFELSVWLSAPLFLHNNSHSHLPLASPLPDLTAVFYLPPTLLFVVFRKIRLSLFIPQPFTLFQSVLFYSSLSQEATRLVVSWAVLSGFCCVSAWKATVWWNFWCPRSYVVSSAAVQISTSLNIQSLRQNKQKQLKLTLTLQLFFCMSI